MRVGVFDSGLGGKSVADAIVKAMPELDVQYASDHTHVPYWTKHDDEVFGYVVPILQTLVDDDCKVIVIACNTVTTTLIDRLRAVIAVPLVAIEPMIKPAAAMTKSGTVAVCATPATLASPRYAELKRKFAQDMVVLEPDCSDWAAMIEQNTINHETIEQRINEVLDRGADVIVLGCTHYHWIEDEIRQLAQNRAIVIQPELATIRQLRIVLEEL